MGGKLATMRLAYYVQTYTNKYHFKTIGLSPRNWV